MTLVGCVVCKCCFVEVEIACWLCVFDIYLT